MLKVFILIIGVLTLVSCSVLIMNHSNGNVIYDVIRPDTNTKMAPAVELQDQEALKIDNNKTD